MENPQTYSLASITLPSPLRLGWIGTGVMGTAMAGHLLARDHVLTVFSRTRYKAEGLLLRGARWAESPARVADASDVVFTMVGFPQDVFRSLPGRRRPYPPGTGGNGVRGHDDRSSESGWNDSRSCQGSWRALPGCPGFGWGRRGTQRVVVHYGGRRNRHRGNHPAAFRVVG